MRPVITLLTDFGTADGYVGEMKGVLLTRVPDAIVVDITHDIAPQDVEAGRLALARVATIPSRRGPPRGCRPGSRHRSRRASGCKRPPISRRSRQRRALASAACPWCPRRVAGGVRGCCTDIPWQGRIRASSGRTCSRNSNRFTRPDCRSPDCPTHTRALAYGRGLATRGGDQRR
jgi:hypothetical protein